MINFFDKIYYINLDRDKNRNEYFLNQFKNTKLEEHLTRFAAIDGRTIKLSDIDQSIITNAARKDIENDKQKTFGITLTYGSLGCALSHKIIFEECAKSIKPFLIFEDDIIINKNFDNDLSILIDKIKKIDQFDIVYLGFHNIPAAKKDKIDDVLSKPAGLTCGTYGYILSPSGADKLLNNIFPLNHQIDSSISHKLKKLNSFCCTKDIVTMNRKFISNTQQKFSCQNQYRTLGTNSDEWNKLFQKGV